MYDFLISPKEFDDALFAWFKISDRNYFPVMLFVFFCIFGSFAFIACTYDHGTGAYMASMWAPGRSVKHLAQSAFCLIGDIMLQLTCFSMSRFLIDVEDVSEKYF